MGGDNDDDDDCDLVMITSITTITVTDGYRSGIGYLGDSWSRNGNLGYGWSSSYSYYRFSNGYSSSRFFYNSIEAINVISSVGYLKR